MELAGNTVLVTGGGSGIGRGLAEALHRMGNQVIITGRREDLLRIVTAANPGMQMARLNVADADAVAAFGRAAPLAFPGLNVLINNAGVQFPEKLLDERRDLSDVGVMVATNLLGPIRLTAALLPLLQRQPRSAAVNVTSALAFVPMAAVPTYCATKAAMHSYTLSLRQQLARTSTDVIEIIPPYVQTDLGPGHGVDPRAMPLSVFISEVMVILKSWPATTEIVVERSKALRFAIERGDFEPKFMELNGAA